MNDDDAAAACVGVLFFIFVGIPLILLCVTAGPLLSIWSVNTLFGTTIAYNFWTWFAALWLSGAGMGMVRAAIRGGK